MIEAARRRSLAVPPLRFAFAAPARFSRSSPAGPASARRPTIPALAWRGSGFRPRPSVAPNGGRLGSRQAHHRVVPGAWSRDRCGLSVVPGPDPTAVRLTSHPTSSLPGSTDGCPVEPMRLIDGGGVQPAIVMPRLDPRLSGLAGAVERARATPNHTLSCAGLTRASMGPRPMAGSPGSSPTMTVLVEQHRRSYNVRSSRQVNRTSTGLDRGIHGTLADEWIAGSSPAMTFVVARPRAGSNLRLPQSANRTAVGQARQSSRRPVLCVKRTIVGVVGIRSGSGPV